MPMVTSDLPAQQTQDIETMLDQYWADVVDGGSTLNQHCFNVLCLLGGATNPWTSSGFGTSLAAAPD